ncbi:PhzF family phenazine biosynthesis protein [Moraxella cuniculi]|uniref:Uncharacterized isomerase yddE n=1 Tax=Moraxella cuniculi TaxID=34061 RepID=A0A3S4SZN8_9GAMM|nr:PhzF family phenazine biosynthesis protein [Moraxella cuniculi]VEG13463.1 Uncharacterized isomerase yddE [Moraxella cuniculi]
MPKPILQYTVDAFTHRVFQGNPAAVCVLDDWLDDATLLNIAKENNLSETAFVVPKNTVPQSDFDLRWFTPTTKIDLCGHATLATAFALTQALATPPDTFYFHTRQAGVLTVQKQDDLFLMDFPAYPLTPVADVAKIGEVLGVTPKAAYLGRDLLCVFDDENWVKNFEPNDEKIAQLDGLLCHITAPSGEFDCVSRSFAPKVGISEDPVCGSGHCHIFPYWAKTLGKTDLIGYQASPRSGILQGKISGDRVVLGGNAVLFAKSEIYL